MNTLWGENLNKSVFVLLLLLFIEVPLHGNAQTKKEQYMTTVSTNSTEVFHPVAAAASDDEAAIRALEERFTAAFNAGDVDAMMKNYIPDQSLVVFDVVPPRQHSGADEYRRAWVGFFTHFRNTPKIAINDLDITVDGNIGFSHSIQHVTGTDTEGHSVDRTVRVTDGYRKVGGNWLIVLEHVSVPVDVKTGKPDFTSKP
jgi:uncharacterized protein (TIGR02246 family)